jgi:hypothetical protein
LTKDRNEKSSQLENNLKQERVEDRSDTNSGGSLLQDFADPGLEPGD